MRRGSNQKLQTALAGDWELPRGQFEIHNRPEGEQPVALGIAWTLSLGVWNYTMIRPFTRGRSYVLLGSSVIHKLKFREKRHYRDDTASCSALDFRSFRTFERRAFRVDSLHDVDSGAEDY